jgi:putative transposase
MGRPLRSAEGGLVYHVFNRANAGLSIFDRDGDYEAFERALAEAVVRHDMRLLSYGLRPHQFQLVLWPRGDGDLSHFMRWLTLTHTQRWHSQHGSIGGGHLYQGRFKSFPVAIDGHVQTVCRYVERQALEAGLVRQAEQWRWSSLWWFALGRRSKGGPPLSGWPVPRPPYWIKRVNTPLPPAEHEAMERSVQRGQPLGSREWQAKTAARLGLESSFRPRGRPRKSPETES